MGAGLIEALRRHGIKFEVFGICGPAMQSQGARTLYSVDMITNIGVEGLIWKVSKILKIRRNLVKELVRIKPDIYIGVDAPDFNLAVESKMKQAGIPTIQYVSPTVWAWRSYRIKKIKRAATKVLTVYPFESEILNRHQVAHSYVGHPLADIIVSEQVADRRRDFGFNSDDTVVAILPGSRQVEVDRLASIFIEAAQGLSKLRPEIKFIAPTASNEIRKAFEQEIAKHPNAPKIKLVDGQSHAVMKSADVVVLASGTAALEATLLLKPFVVSYKVSKLTHILIKLLGHVDQFCIVNHLAGRTVVPEFMQTEATAKNIIGEVIRLLDDADYAEQMVNSFRNIASELRCQSHDKSALEIANLMQNA